MGGINNWSIQGESDWDDEIKTSDSERQQWNDAGFYKKEDLPTIQVQRILERENERTWW